MDLTRQPQTISMFPLARTTRMASFLGTCVVAALICPAWQNAFPVTIIIIIPKDTISHLDVSYNNGLEVARLVFPEVFQNFAHLIYHTSSLDTELADAIEVHLGAAYNMIGDRGGIFTIMTTGNV